MMEARYIYIFDMMEIWNTFGKFFRSNLIVRVLINSLICSDVKRRLL